jgi:hypothetical protein
MTGGGKVWRPSVAPRKGYYKTDICWEELLNSSDSINLARNFTS